MGETPYTAQESMTCYTDWHTKGVPVWYEGSGVWDVLYSVLTAAVSLVPVRAREFCIAS